MKLFATAFSLPLFMTGASAFTPMSTNKVHNSRVSPLNVALDELKGYYVNTDMDISDKIPSDAGFDPLKFAETEGGLSFMREAEIKHARLAMLAVSHLHSSDRVVTPFSRVSHSNGLVVVLSLT